MRKENPELLYLAGDDWRPTHTRYLRQEELKDRLNAYTELSVKYAKSVIELDAAQLILDTDERHRIEYSLELLLQRITNRLDEILNILARDNMLRKRGKKRVYTLPRINPRAANLNSTEDAQKLGREIQDDVMEILHYAFNPIPRRGRGQNRSMLRWLRYSGRQHEEEENKPAPHRPQQHNQSKYRPKHRQTTPHGELRPQGKT